jgi:hypothetical protein
MITRYEDCYDAWCEALKHNSLRIEDVLEKEGNLWLMEDDWKKVWIERGYEEGRYFVGTEDNDDSKFSSCSNEEDSSKNGEGEEADSIESDPGTILSANAHTEYDDEASEYHTTEHINHIISSEIVSMLAQPSGHTQHLS